MASGPEAGLEIIDSIADDPVLVGYHFVPSVRGDMLSKLGGPVEGRAEIERPVKCDIEVERSAVPKENERSLIVHPIHDDPKPPSSLVELRRRPRDGAGFVVSPPDSSAGFHFYGARPGGIPDAQRKRARIVA